MSFTLTTILHGFPVFLGNIPGEQPILHGMLLMLAIVIPLAVAISLSVSGKLSDAWVKGAALFGFFVPAIISVYLTMVYLSLGFHGGYAFQVKMPLGLEDFGIQLHLGLNGISLPMYLLAGIVGFSAGFYAIQSGGERLRLMVVLLLVMQGGLMGVFSSIDVVFFYFFHEFALIPTFVMMLVFGRRGRKTVALELTIYLTLGAMITLAGLIVLYFNSGVETFNMIALRDAVLETSDQSLVFGLLLIGFGILVSLFPFHTWAPRGYATAPAPAAMLHAGVLKKFGLYGLIQIAYPLLPEGAVHWGPLLMWLALGNIIIIGFVTMAQRDLKLMLGNASVMHMGYIFLGLFAFSTLGTGAAVLLMFAHGLSIALLFLLADVIEKRTETMEFEDLGGLGTQTPVLMAFFVAATLASIGLPGFANFWGELGIFIALWNSPVPWVLIVAALGIIISAIYGLRAVARIFYGEKKLELSGGDITISEKIPALILLISLFVVGIWPRFISDNIDNSVEQQLQHTPQTLEIATRH